MKVHTLKAATVALLASAMLIVPASASQAASQEPSAVIDTADLFTPAEEQNLTNWFSSIYATRDIAGVVETINGLPAGTDIEEFSLARANELGVGEADKGNGVYILISVDDREARLELGSGITGAVSDDEALNIMDEEMVPRFADEQWVEGVQAGVLLVGQAYAPTDAEVAAAQQVEQERAVAAEQAGAWWASFWQVAGMVVGAVAAVLFSIWLFRLLKRVRRQKHLHALSRVEEALSQTLAQHNSKALASAVGHSERMRVAKQTLDTIISTLLPKRQQKWLTDGIRNTFVTRQVPKSVDAYLNREVVHSYRFVTLRDVKLLADDLLYTDSLEKVVSTTAVPLRKLEATKKEENRKRQVWEAEKARLARIQREKDNREAERRRKEEEKAAKKFWDSLSSSEQAKLKSTRNKRDRERLVSNYGGDTSMLPLWVSFGFMMGASSSSSSSSSYSSGGGSYDSSSSFSSASFGGGSFDGGGASGSW